MAYLLFVLHLVRLGCNETQGASFRHRGQAERYLMGNKYATSQRALGHAKSRFVLDPLARELRDDYSARMSDSVTGDKIVIDNAKGRVGYE